MTLRLSPVRRRRILRALLAFTTVIVLIGLPAYHSLTKSRATGAQLVQAINSGTRKADTNLVTCIGDKITLTQDRPTVLKSAVVNSIIGVVETGYYSTEGRIAVLTAQYPTIHGQWPRNVAVGYACSRSAYNDVYNKLPIMQLHDWLDQIDPFRNEEARLAHLEVKARYLNGTQKLLKGGEALTWIDQVLYRQHSSHDDSCYVAPTGEKVCYL